MSQNSGIAKRIAEIKAQREASKIGPSTSSTPAQSARRQQSQYQGGQSASESSSDDDSVSGLAVSFSRSSIEPPTRKSARIDPRSLYSIHLQNTVDLENLNSGGIDTPFGTAGGLRLSSHRTRTTGSGTGDAMAKLIGRIDDLTAKLKRSGTGEKPATLDPGNRDGNSYSASSGIEKMFLDTHRHHGKASESPQTKGELNAFFHKLIQDLRTEAANLKKGYGVDDRNHAMYNSISARLSQLSQPAYRHFYASDREIQLRLLAALDATDRPSGTPGYNEVKGHIRSALEGKYTVEALEQVEKAETVKRVLKKSSVLRKRFDDAKKAVVERLVDQVIKKKEAGTLAEEEAVHAIEGPSYQKVYDENPRLRLKLLDHVAPGQAEKERARLKVATVAGRPDAVGTGGCTSDCEEWCNTGAGH